MPPTETPLEDPAGGPLAAGAFSRRERELMDILLAADGLTAEQVREAMAAPPSNAAVRATLRGLLDKGLVTRAYDGPRYLYRVAGRQKARASALERLVRVFFGGSLRRALVGLLELESSELTPAARARVRQAIRDAEGEGR